MRAVSRPGRVPPPPLFLLAVALLTGPAGAYKLNVPKVLLPFSRDKRVPFVLGAEGGCYSWYSTRHDMVTIDPIYENGTLCSQKALLTTRSLQATKLASVIIAEETVTGHLLRCDIIVDLIGQVEIVSRTREIYVEDSPLELSVRALDAEGNTFSSLEGLEFEWSVAKDDEMENLELSKKIRILKYSEAEYSPPDYIVQMETEEKQGDRILVSGIKTGAAVIKVRIQEPVYKKVAAALVRLLVLENIFLMPSYDVFLLVGAYIKYRVGKIVQGKITEVELPLEHYELELQDEVKAPNGFLFLPVAQLDTGTATVTALQLGQVNLAFVHKNIHMRGSLGLPNCTIYVVEPGFLGFTVQPGNRWVLEVRRTYTITVEVFDKSSTKVYPSDNLRITHQFPQEYFEEFTSSANGSYHIVQVLKEGVTVIKAMLLSVLLQSGLEDYFVSPISHEQEMKIYLPITLTPSSLAFPYHSLDLSYRYKVQVEGGSGNFTWTSSNQSVATVTIKGVVAAGLTEGQSAVQARDVQNPFHFGEIQVYVLKLSKMELLPLHADAEIGQTLEVQLAMYHIEKKAGTATPFTDCSLLALDVSMDKQGVFALSEEGKQKFGATFCSTIQLMAKSLGHTLVTASVTVFEEYFETSATFAAYEPLKAVNPVQLALITWHSMKEMVFEGGPGPWVLEPSRFFLELKMDDKKKFQVAEVRLPARRKQNQYIYRVTCLELGEQVFTFQVGNHPGVLNPSPAVETVQVNFLCAHPASMAVTPVYKMAAGTPPCPLPQHHKQLVPVSSLRNTILELALFDQHRRKFDNFSSLILEWTSANESLARFTHPRSMQMVEKDDGTGQTRLHGHQLLEVHQIKGTVLIAVSFVKYSERGSPKEVSNSPASAAVELLLVEDVTVVPDNVTMYNHPDVKEVFALVEGSGYFLINSSTQDMANITYLETESAIQVIPVVPGSLALEVYDLCLTFLGPATAYLRVSNMYELEVDLIDKVEIGKSVLVSVRVLGSHRSAFRTKYFAYMHVQLKAASPIVSLTPMEELGDYSEVYMLRAVAVGQTTLVATAWDKMGVKFMSPPRKVEIFPPFRLFPEKTTLIPHNMVQVMSEGGPQPQSLIHFSISNRTVAEVNGLGQITAKAVGTAFILGTIRAVNEDTGKVIVFSQDQVELEVVELRMIRIHAPATRLVTGTQMPVYVVGLTSTLTPFSFGNSRPPLTFHWAVSKRDILDLLPRHSEISLALPPESNFAMVVQTRAAGRTSIRVAVQTSDAKAGQFEGNVTELLDEVQILVFDKLQLFSPECPLEQILMSMNSQLKLLTNRDGAAFVSTQILQCFPNSSVIEEDGHGLLKAGAVTGTAVLEVTSLELFGVNQTVITGVRVAPVSYLQFSSTPKLYTATRAPLLAFPLGMALTLTVRFFDSAGVRFHAQNNQLHLALNRDDLLLIRPSNQNYTYTAQAVNRGVTLVGVWDERHPGMADYISVPVEHAIGPHLSAPLAVGDVVCFSTPLVNQEGEPGTWQISPSDVLEMDVVSGATFAKHPGKATVFHEIPGIVKTYREVVVHSPLRLSLQLGPKNFLTNAANASEFRAVNPVQLALITWHSMKEMVFEGGPGPWVLEPSRFFLELKMDDKKKFQVAEVRLPARRKQNQYIYRVTCLELGEQVFTFQVGNHPGVLNPSPAVETVQVNFLCAHPASMAVTPVYKMAAGTPPCPLPQHHKQLVPVSSLRNTILELALFDQHRRKFDNFSSLILEWTSANESLARFTHPRSMQMVEKDDGTGQTRLHAVELLLVEDVTVVPDNVTMYNHPDVKEVFALVEGSGYFLINSSTQDMANITYLETESAIQVIPVVPGSLALEVYDLCLTFLGPATAYLRVSNMYELEVDLIDKVEIGKSVLVSVRVLGSHRSAFRTKYFAYMHVQLKAASPIVSLTPMEELGDYSEVYMLRAVAVGQTTLVATAWDKMGVKFMSPPRKVEIFPPFRLFPEKTTLIPHNMVQVMSEGGPQPQSLIHFSISNRTVAEVNGLGQITAKAVGTAFILGTIRAVNEDTGKVIVFSQDQVELEVVELRMIRIHAPATRLVTGTQMPVYVVGLTSTLTPFSFGNSRPPLTFHWAVSKRDILDLLPRHSEISLALPPESNFAMVVQTRAAGRTSIRVAVQTSDAKAGQFEGNVTELLDEVQILVFDKLQLFSPECPLEQILMSMNSQLKLLTNRDGAAFVSTQILQCFPNSSVIEEDGHGLLKAGAVTGTAVLEVTSLELFGVNQTVITGVRVAPVSYLQFSSTPKLYTATRAPLLAFPLGMALTLTVRFFDSAGVRFHAQNNQLHLALNRDDLLLIRPSNQNYTYTAQAVNRGVTLVGVWDERHPGMADYISVPVEHAIGPHLSAPLAVGDVVCFSTPLVNQEGEPGTWQISPSDVLEMDVVSGATFAKHPGKATVFHEIPGIVKTYREVVVHSPLRLSLQLGPKNFLTNAANASEFRVFISTSGPTTLQGPCSSEQIRAITDLSPESQLICQLNFNPSILDIPASKIFHIRPAFYPDKGLYACLVTVKAHPEEDLLALSTAEGFVDVSAALRSEQTRETQRVTVPFLPAFFLNQSEIVLSSSQMTSEILVLGARRVTEAIEAHPSSPVVQVDPPLLLPDMPGLVLFPIRVVNLTSLHRRAAPVFVNVSCGLTGQRAAVLVRPEQEQHPSFDLCAEASLVRQLVGSYQVLLFTIFAVLASTMVIFLIYNAFLNRVQTVPVVYIPSASTQDGYLYPPPSAQHHPSSLRNRTQAWLWSVRR